MNKSKIDINNSEQVQRTIRRARNKMTKRVIRICAVCMLIVFMIISVPDILYAFQHQRIYQAQKQAMLINQFSSPTAVSGFSVDNNSSYNKEILLFYNNVAGRNLSDGNRGEISIEYNLLNGKMNLYYPICGSFMHINRYNGLTDESKQWVDDNNDAALRAMEKNKDTTVALVEVSFAQSYTIDEILKLTQEYDIEINWFAIESGYEGNEPPSNIGMPMQQYYTFGFPAKLYTPDTIFEPKALSQSSTDEYIDALRSNYEWMYENQKLLSNDLWIFEDGVRNAVLNNDLMCYGIQINGPTDEFFELIGQMDIAYINISDLKLWYW